MEIVVVGADVVEWVYGDNPRQRWGNADKESVMERWGSQRAGMKRNMPGEVIIIRITGAFTPGG